MRFLIVASFAESVVRFRGDLIKALLSRGIEVHVAVPAAGDANNSLSSLSRLGVVVHGIPLSRTGTNPLADITSVSFPI